MVLNMKKITLNIVLVLSVCSLLTFTFPFVEAQSWTTRTAMPTARGQASVILAPNGLIYVIGGYNISEDEVTTVEAYDPNTDTWTTKAPLLSATRGASATVGLDGLIYVFGGYNTSSVYATQIYDPLLDTWSYGADMPIAQWGAGAAAALNGKIYVIGGEDDPNATLIYDPVADSWSSGAQMPTERLEHVVVLGPDALIYAIGGMNYSDVLMLDVDAYNPDTDTWMTRAPLPSGRCWMGVTTGLSTSYVIGGGNGTEYIDVNEEAASLDPTKIYVFGGGTDYSNNAPPVYGDTYVYDPTTDAWSTGTAMPTTRREQGAITLPITVFPVGGEILSTNLLRLLAPYLLLLGTVIGTVMILYKKQLV
jgi:N-acetylneuraminic acid mutarotase